MFSLEVLNILPIDTHLVNYHTPLAVVEVASRLSSFILDNCCCCSSVCYRMLKKLISPDYYIFLQIYPGIYLYLAVLFVSLKLIKPIRNLHSECSLKFLS